MINKSATALALSFGLMTFVGCSGSQREFVAEGHVLDAEGQMLYLEEVGTGNVMSLDSVRLGRDGAFAFRHDGTRYPMFFRLRLGDQSIPFAADSLTRLVVKTSARDYFAGYELEDADPYNHQIREIALMRYATDRSIDSVLARYTAGQLDLEAAREQVLSIADGLKRTLITRFIFPDPKSPAAYFALFQRKGDGAYFSTEEDGDDRAFGAVATAYDTHFKDAPYTPFLKDMALQAVARARVRRSWETSPATNEPVEVETIAFPEISLRDNKGQLQTLSALAERGPVLLSFTAYQAQWSPLLVGTLRDMKTKRPDLTIYEVSLDGDDYYWQNAARTLPWICVNDPEGQTLQHYNVQSLPAFFYISGGELHRLNTPEDALRR